MSRQPLRGGFADLDIAEPPRLPEEGGDAKKADLLSSQHRGVLAVVTTLLCPSPEPDANLPPISLGYPDVGQVAELNRTVCGYEHVSRTEGPFYRPSTPALCGG